MVTKKKSKSTRTSKSSNNSSMTYHDSMLFEIELEISKLKREKSVFVLNKSIFLYFFFILIGVLGLITGYDSFFNLLVILGLLTIITGSIPYINTMYKEEQNLKDMVERLKKLN